MNLNNFKAKAEQRHSEYQSHIEKEKLLQQKLELEQKKLEIEKQLQLLNTSLSQKEEEEIKYISDPLMKKDDIKGRLIRAIGKDLNGSSDKALLNENDSRVKALLSKIDNAKDKNAILTALYNFTLSLGPKYFWQEHLKNAIQEIIRDYFKDNYSFKQLTKYNSALYYLGAYDVGVEKGDRTFIAEPDEDLISQAYNPQADGKHPGYSSVIGTLIVNQINEIKHKNQAHLYKDFMDPELSRSLPAIKFDPTSTDPSNHTLTIMFKDEMDAMLYTKALFDFPAHEGNFNKRQEMKFKNITIESINNGEGKELTSPTGQKSFGVYKAQIKLCGSDIEKFVTKVLTLDPTYYHSYARHCGRPFSLETTKNNSSISTTAVNDTKDTSFLGSIRKLLP